MRLSTDAPTRVALLGATGRMGQTLAGLIDAAADLELVGAFGQVQEIDTVGGVRIVDEPAAALPGADVAIDFTLAAVTDAVVEACVAARVPLVSGTTGLPAATEQKLHAAASQIPLLYDHNMSLGVAVLTRLVEQAASALADSDIEIVESHHKDKRDAPSGTAIKLGRAAANARGQSLDDVARWASHGDVGARAPGSIGFASVRGGAVVGEHRVELLAEMESLILEHRANTRDVFAQGALTAARWLTHQSPGQLYRIADVAGLNDSVSLASDSNSQ